MPHIRINNFKSKQKFSSSVSPYKYNKVSLLNSQVLKKIILNSLEEKKWFPKRNHNPAVIILKIETIPTFPPIWSRSCRVIFLKKIKILRNRPITIAPLRGSVSSLVMSGVGWHLRLYYPRSRCELSSASRSLKTIVALMMSVAAQDVDDDTARGWGKQEKIPSTRRWR